jgi:hypothetical protein
MNTVIPKGLPEHFKKVWKEHTGQTIQDINEGWCYQFAMVLHLIHGRKLRFHNTVGHCWVSYKGVHYDANHPHGVSYELCNWQSVCLNNIKEVETYWNEHGYSGTIQWEIVNQVASDFLSNKTTSNVKNRRTSFLTALNRGISP